MHSQGEQANSTQEDVLGPPRDRTQEFQYVRQQC